MNKYIIILGAISYELYLINGIIILALISNYQLNPFMLSTIVILSLIFCASIINKLNTEFFNYIKINSYVSVIFNNHKKC